MKLKRITAMIAMCLLTFNTALAEDDLSTVLTGNQLVVEWMAESDNEELIVPENENYTGRLKTSEDRFETKITTKQTLVDNKKQTEVCNGDLNWIPTAAPTQFPTVVLMVNSDVDQTEVLNSDAALMPVATGFQSMTSMASEVIRQVNADRAKYGLAPLSVSAQLTSAASIRANEIVEKFSHTRPDGSSWSTVTSAAAGENIAKGHSNPDRVMAAWMTSEGHRANILRKSFGSIGVCALKVNGVIYWVQLFGR